MDRGRVLIRMVEVGGGMEGRGRMQRRREPGGRPEGLCVWAVTSALPAIQVCTDINECETGQHNCVPNSVCVNTRVRPGRSGEGSRHWGWVRSGRQPKLTARGPGPGLLPVRPLPARLRGRPDIWLQAALTALLPGRHAQPVPREGRLHPGTRWLAIVRGECGRAGRGVAWV